MELKDIIREKAGEVCYTIDIRYKHWKGNESFLRMIFVPVLDFVDG